MALVEKVALPQLVERSDVGDFVYIAGMSRCGSKWLANVLDDPIRGVKFTHELASPDNGIITNFWWDGRQRHALQYGVGSFAAYWRILRDLLANFRVVGDAISWVPLLVPDMHEQVPVRKVIYLVRNGIQQVHSLWNNTSWRYYHNANDTNENDVRWNYEYMLHRYWDMLSRPGQDWHEWSEWERICLMWQANTVVTKWLNDLIPGVYVGVHRLEDLIGDISALRRLVENVGLQLDDGELVSWQEYDMNRLTKGDRSPATLYASWTLDQQNAFDRICGSGMEEYGYERHPV